MPAANLKIVTAAQMVALEQASERQGVSTDCLMENAGLAVAEAIRRQLGGVAGAKVLVLVGSGNNGADGLVAARHLRRWGARASVYLATRRPIPDPKMDLALEYGVAVYSSANDPQLAELAGHLHGCRLVLDAVLGTGTRGVSWKDIEVLRRESGEPHIRLHGRAEERAQRLGVMEISLSLSHCQEYAVAFVVAQSGVAQSGVA